MAAAKPRPTDLDATVGRNVRRIREQLGASHDQVAQVLRDRGWRASVPMLHDIENGQRGIRLAEALALADALNVSVADLLTSDDIVRVYDALADNGTNLARRLTEPPRSTRSDITTWAELQQSRRFLEFSALTGPRHSTGDESMREAERHAAQRLGITPREVVERSYALWGRTLSDERDERARRLEQPADSKRRRAAIRSHVTRALLDELRQGKHRAR